MSENLPGQNNNNQNNNNDDDEEEIIVADYDFAGIDQIAGVTRSAARLEWTDYPGAKEYYIYNMTLGIPVFMNSVEAPANSYQIENLTTPEFTYRYRVRVLTHFGLDSNTKDVEVTTDPFIKPDTVAMKFPEENPSNKLRPYFIVSDITKGDVVNLYRSLEDGGTKCDVKVGEATATSNEVEVLVDTDLIEGTNLIYANVTFPNNEDSECSDSFASYELDLTPPSLPSGLAVSNPTMSANLTNPKVTVSGVNAGDTIKLYSSNCEKLFASKVAEGTSVEFQNYLGITESGYHRFHATAKDTSGNESECSTASADHYYFKGLLETKNVSDSTADLVFDYFDEISSYTILIKPKSQAQYNENYAIIVPPINNLVTYGLLGLSSNKEHDVSVIANFSNGYIDTNGVALKFTTIDAPPPPVGTSSQTTFNGGLNVSFSGIKPGDTIKIFSDLECTNEIDSQVVPPGLPGESSARYTISLGVQTTGDNFYAQAIGDNPSECVAIKACPIGYAVVQGDSRFGTPQNFCVDRLEARPAAQDIEYLNTSNPYFFSQTGPVNILGIFDPVTDISFKDALDRCRNSGHKYDLITNAEWTIIANQIFSEGENWTGGAVGDGCLKVGNTRRGSVPAGCEDMSIDEGGVVEVDSFDIDGEPTIHSSRILKLPSGDTLIDFSGNASEWVNFYPSFPVQPSYARGYTPLQHYYKPFYEDDGMPTHRIISFEDPKLYSRWRDDLKIFFGPLLDLVDAVAPPEAGNDLMDEGFGGYSAIPFSEDDSFRYLGTRGGSYQDIGDPPSNIAGMFNVEFVSQNYQRDNLGFRCVYRPYFPDCPEGFVYVPPNDYTNNNDKHFCVMKFEAKNEAGVAVSKATDNPWVNVTINQARQACTDLGDDYDLINNNQWATIANHIESSPGNWFWPAGDPFRGKGCLSAGIQEVLDSSYTSTCGGMVVDAISHDGLKFGDDNREGIEFHNLGVQPLRIWNLAGNAAEFVLDVYDNNSISETNKSDQLLSMEHESTFASGYNQEAPWEFDYSRDDRTNWFGDKYLLMDSTFKYYQGNTGPGNGILIRGGNGDGVGGGIYSFSFLNEINHSNEYTGFRCTYNGIPKVSDVYDTQNIKDGKLDRCPDGYAFIKKNPKRGVYNDFCVMEGEAEMYRVGIDIYPHSDGDFEKWLDTANVNIAIQDCRSLGEGFELISSQEWSTIAEEVESNPVNWSSGVVGEGCLYRGLGVNGDPNEGCTTSSLKTLTGDTIRDFAGGYPEFVDYYSHVSQYSFEIYETDEANLLRVKSDVDVGPGWYNIKDVENFPKDIFITENYYNQYDEFAYFGSTVNDVSSKGGGKFKYKDFNDPAGENFMLIRGGGRGDGENTGVWAAEYVIQDEVDSRDIGFRCVYRFK